MLSSKFLLLGARELFGGLDKKIFDLFAQNIYFGDHKAWDKERIIPRAYSCHSPNAERADLFHQAIHREGAIDARKLNGLRLVGRITRQTR